MKASFEMVEILLFSDGSLVVGVFASRAQGHGLKSSAGSVHLVVDAALL